MGGVARLGSAAWRGQRFVMLQCLFWSRRWMEGVVSTCGAVRRSFVLRAGRAGRRTPGGAWEGKRWLVLCAWCLVFGGRSDEPGPARTRRHEWME